MSDLKVALIQSIQHWEDKTKNFSHFSKLILGIEGEIDLIVLPEMFNTGFSMNLELAEDEDGCSVEFLKQMAKTKNCHIGASLMYLDQEKVYNSFLIVDENGIQARYDKRHLFSLGKEDQFFAPGSKQVRFNLKGWNLNLQVCYDLRFPVFARNNVNDPYDCLIYIANWPEKRAKAWNSLTVARAIENQSFVLGVNRIGYDDNNLTYNGGSVIIDPVGNELAKAKNNEEEVLILSLNKESLIKSRKSLPFLNDGDAFTLNSTK